MRDCDHTDRLCEANFLERSRRGCRCHWIREKGEVTRGSTISAVAFTLISKTYVNKKASGRLLHKVRSGTYRFIIRASNASSLQTYYAVGLSPLFLFSEMKLFGQTSMMASSIFQSKLLILHGGSILRGLITTLRISLAREESALLVMVVVLERRFKESYS